MALTIGGVFYYHVDRCDCVRFYVRVAMLTGVTVSDVMCLLPC